MALRENLDFNKEYNNLNRNLRDANYISDEGKSSVKCYIDAMEKLRTYGIQHIPTWSSDYDILSQYCHLRNKIVHEDKFEDELFTQEDIYWIRDFNQRFLSQMDPIALLRKVAHRKKSSVRNVSKPNQNNQRKEKASGCKEIKNSGMKLKGCFTFVIIILIISLLILSYYVIHIQTLN